MFKWRTNESQDIAYGGLLYDVIWVLAMALNKTMTMIKNNVDINETNCEDVPGSLVPLEQFTYANEKMGCLIQWNIQKTSFLGVSVSNHAKLGSDGELIVHPSSSVCVNCAMLRSENK